MANKILFVCKHNIFRSKVAEACFNKLNEDKDFVASSAGIIRGNLPFNKNMMNVAGKLGIKIQGKPAEISINLIKEQSVIILVADDVPMSLFNDKDYIGSKRRVIHWMIPDITNPGDVKSIKEIMNMINKKVELLVRKLETDNGK